MKYIIFLFVFTLSLLKNANCQKTKVKLGLYEGGFESGNQGNWFLKKDSTFIFVNFEGYNIRHIGLGNWIADNDSMIKFTFTNEALPILQKANCQYLSETKAPYDSVFIKGQLKNVLNMSIEKASIIINGKYEVISNEDGYFSISYPRLFSPQELIVIKKISGYEIVKFNLNSTANYHKLNIIIPVIDSTSCNTAYNSNLLMQPLQYKREFKMRYYTTLVKKKQYNSISLISEDVSKLTQKLLKAKINQQYLLANINQLLELTSK
jgi:hypothetical protein